MTYANRVIEDRNKRRAAMSAALAARCGVAAHEADNPFRSHSLYDMARACVEAASVNIAGMDKIQVVRAAISHSTSDFPALLGNAVKRSVQLGYAEAPEIFPQFTHAVTVSDYRPTTLAGLGPFTGVAHVPENAQYPHGTMAESGSVVQLSKRGAKFTISHEAIVNDDLNVFGRVPAKMGAAAKQHLGDEVFALLTGNPVLPDGVALFHATHGNLRPASAPTTASVDAMISTMALQTDANGAKVRVPLKFLLVPVGLGGGARQILDSQYEVGSSKDQTAPNYVRGRFVVLEDARLDAASATAWYGIGDPALSDGIAIAYRDGNQEPTVEERAGWEVDGIEFKVRLEAQPVLTGYTGLQKNPGA